MNGLLSRFVQIGLFASMTVASSALSAPYLPQVGATAQAQDEATNVRVYRQASPAVVSIETDRGSGSGSIITADGLVLTNAHVLGGASTARVRLADGRTFTADVVGYASDGLDLAAVQIRDRGLNLPVVTLAPGEVQVGQQAFAIGDPFGLQGTFTVGIVSRIDRERGLIQTDAAINPGNSGGPLLNSRSELIGVNTSIFTTSGRGGSIGIGFAIATNEIRPFIAAVQAGTAPTTASRSRQAERPVETLTVDGPRVSGQLDERSGLFADNSYFNMYQFDARAGQRVAIEMLSNQIDPYLILVGPNQEDLGQDDDGAGGVNARLETILPTSGTYLILANSYGASERGRYDLQITSLGASETTGSYLLQQSGQLTASDPQLSDGSRYDEHRFQGEAGQQVTIRLSSPEFDTYLLLIDESGNRLAENDDVAGSTDSEIVMTLPQT
ncbi:MAG: trypsin-like serine protease, partial [Leptolyngbya sp. SIO4C1]|nr:trypsin-like serine protease [Leptolyngbya sp. SIO4C1]